MPDPINYAIDVQSPFQAALQGYASGAAVRDDQQQQQALQVQRDQQAALREAYSQAAASPTADNFTRLMLLDPKASEGIKRAWDVKNTQQQQAQTADLLQYGSAIKSGRPDIAAQQLTQRADALEAQNGGQPNQDSQLLRTWAKVATDHPEFALGQIQALLAANPNGKDAAETLAKFGTERRADQLQPDLVRKGAADANKAGSEATTAAVTAQYAEPVAKADLAQRAAQLGLTKAQVRDIDSQIGNRAAQLGLDRQKLQLEVDKFAFEKTQKAQDIGQDGRKLVNDAAVTAGAAKLSADRANDLADRVTQIGTSWGAAGGFAEWYAKQTGSQDAVSELRSQYTQLRNSEGVKNLPPGPASDKDVELAMQGIPPPTADPKVMQSWLRGVAKLNDVSAAVENARADYAANNKGLLGRAKNSFQAGGTDVVSGDSWVQISKRVAESAARKYVKDADKARPSGVDQIPNNPPGTPASAATNVGAPTKVVSWDSIRDR